MTAGAAASQCIPALWCLSLVNLVLQHDCYHHYHDDAWMLPGGGALIGCQNREFGRARRPQRLAACPLLYVGTQGFLNAALPHLPSDLFRRSTQQLPQACWHQAAVSLVPWGPPTGDIFLNFAWCLYLNGTISSSAPPPPPLSLSLPGALLVAIRPLRLSCLGAAPPGTCAQLCMVLAPQQSCFHVQHHQRPPFSPFPGYPLAGKAGEWGWQAAGLVAPRSVPFGNMLHKFA